MGLFHVGIPSNVNYSCSELSVVLNYKAFLIFTGRTNFHGLDKLHKEIRQFDSCWINCKSLLKFINLKLIFENARLGEKNNRSKPSKWFFVVVAVERLNLKKTVKRGKCHLEWMVTSEKLVSQPILILSSASENATCLCPWGERSDLLASTYRVTSSSSFSPNTLSLRLSRCSKLSLLSIEYTNTIASAARIASVCMAGNSHVPPVSITSKLYRIPGKHNPYDAWLNVLDFRLWLYSQVFLWASKTCIYNLLWNFCERDVTSVRWNSILKIENDIFIPSRNWREVLLQALSKNAG